MTSVEAKDGQLRIVYSGGTAVFTLGDQAAKWADRIKNPKSRIDKLGIKPDHHVAVFNVKDVAFIKELRARATFVSIAEPIKNADAIFLGAMKLDGLTRTARARALHQAQWRDLDGDAEGQVRHQGHGRDGGGQGRGAGRREGRVVLRHALREQVRDPEGPALVQGVSAAVSAGGEAACAGADAAGV